MRTAGPLQIESSLKRRLLHLRVITGTPTPAEVCADDVERVERTIGRELSDPILALMANGDPALARHEIALGFLETHAESLRAQRGPRGLIAIGKEDKSGGVIAIAPLGGRLCIWDVGNSGVRELPLLEWLDELISLEKEALRHEEGEDRARLIAKVNDEDVETFVPALTAAAEQERVEHPKFGSGKILREFDGEKLEIEFADGSVRTLLARFVRRG